MNQELQKSLGSTNESKIQSASKLIKYCMKMPKTLPSPYLDRNTELARGVNLKMTLAKKIDLTHQALTIRREVPEFIFFK